MEVLRRSDGHVRATFLDTRRKPDGSRCRVASGIFAKVQTSLLGIVEFKTSSNDIIN
jgi:hypothetical protein